VAKLDIDFLRDLQVAGFPEKQAEALIRVISDKTTALLVTKADLADFELRLEKRFAEIDKRFGEIDKRFVSLEKDMDKRFEEVEKRFVDMEKHFVDMEKRFVDMEKRFVDMENKMLTMEGRIIKWVTGIVVTTNLAMVGAVAMIVALVK
jgi:predicted  nucleic acid-binding Zn-ribbon protein